MPESNSRAGHTIQQVQAAALHGSNDESTLTGTLAVHAIFFHPDCTVGLGFSPKSALRLAALVCNLHHHRRWGIPPRPEDHI